MASTASTRQQAIMEMMFKVLAETKEATATMNAFQKQTLATFNKLNQNIEGMSRRTQRNVKVTTKQTQSDMSKIMAAPFAGRGGTSGFNKSIDDFVLRENQMRGVTTGLRHEVGKLRNTLLLFVFATATVVNAFRQWFNEIVRSEAALVGLKSVAMNTGQSFEVLRDISLEMEQKGFLSLGGGAAALKNLSASNLTIRESVSVLKALTDAAAFNRQGTLSMEEAIVGATQGIKNQNSIMIDNAGITKNVSVMYREYAASIGKTSGSLTEMEKRQAIVIGVLKEASLFAGNAEKSLDSYQGRLTKFQTTLISLKRDMGAIIVSPLIDTFGRIVKTFEGVSKGGGLGKEIVGGVVSAVYSAVDLIMTLIEQLISSLNQINEALKTITFNIASIGKILDSPYVKLLAFLAILGKINSYFTTLLTKLRVNTLEKSFNVNLNQNLREAIILRNNYKNIWWDTNKAAMQEAKISAQINLETKKGNAELYIKEAFEKRINYLLNLRNKTKIQELELQARINALTQMGFEGIQTPGRTRDPRGRFIKQTQPTLAWSPAGTMKIDSKQTLLYNAELGDVTRANLSLFGKVKMEWGNIRKELSNVSLLASRFWDRNAKGASNATRMTITWASTLKSAGRSIANVFAIVGNSLMKVFMWYTLIMTAVEIVKDLFASKTQDLEKINREIKLELDGTKGILINYEKISSEIKARSKIFNVTGGKNYLDIITKTGMSVGTLSSKLAKLANEVEGYQTQLRAYQFQSIEGGKVNEEQLEKTKERLEAVKTEYNSYYQIVIDSQDKLNTAFEETITLLEKWGNTSKGSFAQLTKNISSLYEDLTKIYANRQFLEVSPLTPDEKEFYQASNRFEVLIKLAYKNYYTELDKIVLDGEKKITETMKKITTMRMNMIRDSIGKQFLDIFNAYDIGMEEVNQKIAEIQLELGFAKADMELQKGIINMRRLSAEAENVASSMSFATNSVKSLVIGLEKQKELDKILESVGKELDKFRKLDVEEMNVMNLIPSGVLPTIIKFKEKLVKAFEFDYSNVFKTRTSIKNIRDEVFNLNQDLDKYRDEKGVYKIPIEELSTFQRRAKELNDEINKLPITVSDVSSEVRKLLESNDPDIKYLLNNLRFIGVDLEKIKFPEGSGEVIKDLSDSMGELGGSVLDSVNSIIASGSALGNLSDIMVKMDELMVKFEGNSEAQVAALKKLGRTLEDQMTKKLKDAREEIIDVSKEIFDLNTSLGILDITLSDMPALFQDMSRSYVDSAGNLKLFDKSAIDLEKRLYKIDRLLEQELINKTKYFSEALKEAKANMDTSRIKELESALEDLGTAIDWKKILLRTIEINNEIDKFIESTQILRNELFMVQNALNAGINTGNIDFSKGLQEVLQTADFMKRQIDEMLIDFTLSIEEIKAAFDERVILKMEIDSSVTLYIQKELQKMEIEAKKVKENIENSLGVINIFGNIIGLDVSKLKEIDMDTKGFIKTIKDHFAELYPEIKGDFDKLPPAVQENFNQMVDDAIKWGEEMKKATVEAGIREMVQSLSDFSFNLGKVIQETQYKVESVQKEQRSALKEQENLYSQGEITAAEKMKRIAEINSYYARVINNIWSQIGRSVLDNITNMGTQIITQIAQQIAVTQALAAFGTGGVGGMFAAIGAGFAAAAPFLPIILGLGMLSAAISNVPELDAPTFDDIPQNQLTKFGGTIRAEEVTITITPTFIIEGQQIFIGSGSVVEYVEEATELMKIGVQQAIDNQEFSFDNIRAIK